MCFYNPAMIRPGFARLSTKIENYLEKDKILTMLNSGDVLWDKNVLG